MLTEHNYESIYYQKVVTLAIWLRPNQVFVFKAGTSDQPGVAPITSGSSSEASSRLPVHPTLSAKPAAAASSRLPLFPLAPVTKLDHQRPRRGKADHKTVCCCHCT